MTEEAPEYSSPEWEEPTHITLDLDDPVFIYQDYGDGEPSKAYETTIGDLMRMGKLKITKDGVIEIYEDR